MLLLLFWEHTWGTARVHPRANFSQRTPSFQLIPNDHFSSCSWCGETLWRIFKEGRVLTKVVWVKGRSRKSGEETVSGDLNLLWWLLGAEMNQPLAWKMLWLQKVIYVNNPPKGCPCISPVRWSFIAPFSRWGSWGSPGWTQGMSGPDVCRVMRMGRIRMTPGSLPNGEKDRWTQSGSWWWPLTLLEWCWGQCVYCR